MSEAIAKPRAKSLQRRDAKLALKASKRYKRMQQLCNQIEQVKGQMEEKFEELMLLEEEA